MPDFDTKAKVAFFHSGFKGAQIFCFLMLGLFTSDQILQFVLTTVLIVLDFWTVKNVSGRLLCGLRWWTTIDEDGNEKWFFECYDKKFTDTEQRWVKMFWSTQVGITLFWILVFSFDVLKFSLFWVSIFSFNFLNFKKIKN